MDDQSDVPPRRPRIRRIALGFALLLVVALAVLWVERRPIATHYIDRTLAAKGVPARYRIKNLGLGRQRLTDVVIGDPAQPDLVADWVETRTTMGWRGPSVTAIRAGHVRMRATLKGGRVSLGSIDRLLPPPSGKPFALPALDVDVADARMRLETRFGLIGLKLVGRGRLDNGFKGTVIAASERLETGECTLFQPRIALRVSVVGAAPSLNGPVRLRYAECGLNDTWIDEPRADLRVTFDAALGRWRGAARGTTGISHLSGLLWYAATGTIGFAGTTATTNGRVDIAARGVGLEQGQGRAHSLTIAGNYVAGRKSGFVGHVAARGIDANPYRLKGLARLRGRAMGTPAAPILDAAVDALLRGSRAVDGDADLRATTGEGTAAVQLTHVALRSASGARASLTGGEGVRWSSTAGLGGSGLVTIAGGGLPTIAASLQRARGEIRGRATVAPYQVRDATLAATPVDFAISPRGARISTTATLSGPLGDGRVEGLTLPLIADWDGRARFIVDHACVPVGFERLAVAGLVVDRSRVTLCPLDGALVRLDEGGIGGGARIAGARFGGRLGNTLVTIATLGASLRLADRGFVVQSLAARLGEGARVTRLDFARLDGRIAGSGVAGAFNGGGGQIGQVPLLLSNAAGRWTLANGALALNGALAVADAAADPRFKPLAARGVTLRLVGGRTDARGTLYEPTKDIKVADVSLSHALASGRGSAELTVPALPFDKGFQPDALTRLTFGVIADVRGTVSGEGHIAWSPDGVTSTGTFRTAGTDLAAAFGPVTGLAGEIRFTDLLALQSAPGQVATVKTINPGIPVENGVIRYRTLPDARIAVEGARWPFAGGSLTLDPTLLDFSRATERRMTFRVEGMAADEFLQQFDFKNLDATGIFDGVIPMVFDERGGRIEGGRLAVRPGGGTIAYVGEISQKDVGTWGNLAFQALKSLRYRDLGIVMNGPLAGEMVTEVRFAGISQGEGAKSNFVIRRLQRLPFVFNIRIRAPFRGLLDSAQSFYDPKRLVQRNLQSLLDEQNRRAQPPIQPPASRTVP